ncbi:NfeD family protein [Novosphingobium pentaromativorans]|uniref:NfeD family protein n=1 Tax=Novosphingobium pentaromativorans TaxID=205844 RepID=UPI00031FC7C4|nr:nodulation protein NfeD [Novosphingobium pentaromativorans]
MDRSHCIAPLRWLLLLCLLFGLWQAALAEPQLPAREVPVLLINGAVGPATADYITKGITSAGEAGAPLVLIRMDTPGGLDTSMREIIRAIVNSPIPVATYVSPSGGRAASAGAFILLASHVAAMAPGTNVGAATPVQMGAPAAPGAEPEGEAKDEPGSDKANGSKSGSASERKALNDAIAYIRSLAEMRGRNADWAEAAVRDADSLSAQAALAQDVIDIVARDSADLLAQLNGRTIQVGAAEIRLDTTGMVLAEVEPDWRTRLLAAITDPNIALILMMIGAYGLLFEFMNPGDLYPGTIGAICLLIGLYALSALPVNYAGIALIVLGMALMAAEAFSPSFGILGIGGVVAFGLGATIMFDTDIPEFRIAVPVLGAVAVASLGATLLTMRLALKSRQAKVVSGREQMVGATGRIVDWNGSSGHVHIHGERWRATGGAAFHIGQLVRVVAIDGLTLTLEPAA